MINTLNVLTPVFLMCTITKSNLHKETLISLSIYEIDTVKEGFRH